MAKQLCIAFQSRRFELADHHRDWAVTALEAGLAPFGHRLGKVLVRMATPGDPSRADRGDSVCSLHLDLHGHGPIHAQSQAPDLRDALREALALTRRQLERVPVSEPGPTRVAL
jgi:hypothetical protein